VPWWRPQHREGNALRTVRLGGAVGGVAGLFAAKRLAGHARLARSLFAGMIILVAIYVAWRSLGG
jgi:uncharacterized membrane protein YfcA